MTLVFTTVHTVVGRYAEGCYNYPAPMCPRSRMPVSLSYDSMHLLDNCNKCCFVHVVGKPAVTVVISSDKNNSNALLLHLLPLSPIPRSYIITPVAISVSRL